MPSRVPIAGKQIKDIHWKKKETIAHETTNHKKDA